MRKLILAAFLFVSTMTTNTFADGHGIKMGIILGFTGPIESLTPAMAASAELAFKEASDSGSLLGGKKISVERADSTCVDSAAATTAAQGLVDGGVVAIMGADCSGVTGAIATTPLETRPSAAAVAAAESTQVESALSTDIFFPPNNEPESEASLKASSAEAAIAGVRDSIGPVKPKMIPILIPCPSENAFVVKQDTKMNIAITNFLIFFL